MKSRGGKAKCSQIEAFGYSSFGNWGNDEKVTKNAEGKPSAGAEGNQGSLLAQRLSEESALRQRECRAVSSAAEWPAEPFGGPRLSVWKAVASVRAALVV